LATVIVACESGERGLFPSGSVVSLSPLSPPRRIGRPDVVVIVTCESGERGLSPGGSMVAEKLYTTIAVEVVTVACESDGSCVSGESGVSCTPVFCISFTL
jgi:hypothetical protein